MASTTAAKKEIIDYLWDWAGTHDWAKLLVHLVVSTEKVLAEEDRETVFEHFLDSLRGKGNKKMTPIEVQKPVYSPSTKVIELTTLKEVAGVNRLAKNQVLQFSKTLTLIYGENGTGKTGYGRILKTLGFSYDPRNVILSNVYGTKEPKSAVIEFTTNGDPAVFTWDGQNANPMLANMSVFNNHCVQLSLNDRQLIVSPIGFHLFGLVTTELSALAGLLRAKIASHSTETPWLVSLHEGTPQQSFVRTLNAKSLEEQLMEVGDWTDAHREALTRRNTELGQLNQRSADHPVG